MNMLKRIILPAALILLISPLLLTISRTDFQDSSSVLAYPPPNQATQTPQNPYPGPASPQNTPASLPPPDSFIADHFHFLPLVIKDPPARFSVSGVADKALLLPVIPAGLQVDSYIWDAIRDHNSPNNNNSIQMIRACTYYREKSTTTNLVTFYEWYQSGKTGHLCWDPIHDKVAEIVNNPACPYYSSGPCLDVEVSSIADTGETKFRTVVHNNPSWIWLIGNEPDGLWQDALVANIAINNGTTTRIVYIGGTNEYAVFFKEMYDLMAEEMTISPRLVFCQATLAYTHPEKPGLGLPYCQQAFTHLQTLGYGSEQIYALSVHQYMSDQEDYDGNLYSGGRLLDGITQPGPAGDTRTVLEWTTDTFEAHLQEFEAWAAATGMGDKPLWLTEYGSWNSWCYEVHSGGQYEVGGIPCPAIDQDYPFYGRNSREGLWGLQMGQMAYLARSDNQWQAAWWFNWNMGRNSDGDCVYTTWLTKADFNCTQNSPRPHNLSRAGETHRQTLECLLNGQNCPVTTTPTATPTPTPTPTATPVPTATPTPTPTVSNSPCGCGGDTKNAICPQVICPDGQN